MKKLLCFLMGVIFGIYLTASADPDSFQGYITKIFKSDQTIQSVGFSEYQYFQIKIGDSKDQVLKRIGEPISWSKKDDNSIFGYWTDQCCHGDFRGRMVVFRNDKVVELIHEMYWD